VRSKGDVFIGAAFSLFALAMYAHTFSDRYVNSFLFGDVSTVFFPRVLLILIALLSGGLVVRGLFVAGSTDGPAVRIGRIAVTYLACVATIAGVWLVGFLIAMPLGIVAIGLAMGQRRLVALIATAVIAPLLVWFVLGRLAQVSFPHGTLF